MSYCLKSNRRLFIENYYYRKDIISYTNLHQSNKEVLFLTDISERDISNNTVYYLKYICRYTEPVRLVLIMNCSNYEMFQL